jgi:hypothetical protein
MGMDDFNLDDDLEQQPSKESSMGIDDFKLDEDLEQPSEEAPLPEESSNRTFLIIAAALGGIALIALVCIAIYALVCGPKTKRAGGTTGYPGGAKYRGGGDHRPHFHLSC